MYSLLVDNGFEVEALAPSREYSVLVANARQLFRQMNRKRSKLLVKPLIALHKLWWKYNPIVPGDPELTNTKRLLKFTGSQHFVATKK